MTELMATKTFEVLQIIDANDRVHGNPRYSEFSTFSEVNKDDLR